MIPLFFYFSSFISIINVPPPLVYVVYENGYNGQLLLSSSQ